MSKSNDLQPHHAAWLAAHPHRDRRWFRARLRDGFDVHHLDGDHDNNDSDWCLPSLGVEK